MEWVVSVPLREEDGTWFELCCCTTPEAVSSVVLALCNAGVRGPKVFKVEVRYL